jgi:hypothetical protein
MTTILPSPARRALAVALVALAAFGVAGCGDDYHDDDTGFLYLWNRTDTTVPEDVVSFTAAPDGLPQSGNLLPDPLLPGDSDYMGEWFEDIYDGVAELAGGTFVDFFDYFVGDHEDTFLQVF